MVSEPNAPQAPLHLFGSSDILLELESTDRYSHIDLTDNSSTARITNDGGTGTLRLRADKDNAVNNSNIQFEIDGSEKVRITSAGAVIIGTDTAATNTELTIKHASPHLSLYATPGQDSRLNMGDTDDHDIGMIAYANSDNSMRFTTNATERFRITSDGNVGIGTDNPLRKLDILGTGRPVEIGSTNATNIVKLYNSATGRSTYNGVDIQSNSTAGGIISAYGGYLDLRTSSSNGSDATSRLRITSSGNIGINDSGPNFHLDVNGNIALREGQVLTWHDGSGNKTDLEDADIYMDSSDNFVIRNTSSVAERLRINSTGYVGINDNNPDTQLSVNSGATNVVAKFASTDQYAWIQFRDNSTTDTAVMVGADGDNLSLRAGSNERVRVTSSGTVKFATNNSSTDYLEWGGNPRLMLQAPAGLNGLRVYGTTTPFEIGGSASTRKISMGGDPNYDLSISADYSLSSGGHDSSPKVFLNATRHNGSGTVTSFQTSIQAVSVSNTAGDGYLGLGASATPDDLIIRPNGNIGINQTSPNAPLSFNTGTGQKIEFYNQGSNNEFGIGVQSSELRISSGTNSFMTFYTNGYSGDERVRITSGGKVSINSTANSDAQLLVKSADKLHPALKLDGLSANGFSLLGDEYQTDESNFTMGIAYSSASLVTGWGVKVSPTASNEYLSSQDTYSTKHSAVRHDGDGWKFLSNSSNQTVTTDSVVSLTEKLRIKSGGEITSASLSINGFAHQNTPSGYTQIQCDNHANTIFGQNLKLGASAGNGNHQIEIINQHATIGGAGMYIGGNTSNQENAINFYAEAANQSAGTDVAASIEGGQIGSSAFFTWVEPRNISSNGISYLRTFGFTFNLQDGETETLFYNPDSYRRIYYEMYVQSAHGSNGYGYILGNISRYGSQVHDVDWHVSYTSYAFSGSVNGTVTHNGIKFTRSGGSSYTNITYYVIVKAFSPAGGNPYSNSGLTDPSYRYFNSGY